jgi:SHS2 domain-containing protein
MYNIGKNTYIIAMQRRIKRVEYKLIPHTADICIELSATTLKQLFDRSASAVTEQMVSIGKKSPGIMKDMVVAASDKDLLFVYWLQEILYQFYLHGLIYTGSKITALSNTRLKAKVAFNRFNPKEHTPKREIKAVTYHNIHIEKTRGKYIVRFVVDI